jgi:hypothetical protein
MRHRRDHLGKDLLDLLLSRWGTLRTEVPVPATDAQRADVSFVPRAELPAALGLLACLGAVPCLFELFSQAPSREELLACQRKLLQWRHTLRKRDRDAEPACWLLCAARPDLALRSLGFTADAETLGIYRNAYGLGVIGKPPAKHGLTALGEVRRIRRGGIRCRNPQPSCRSSVTGAAAVYAPMTPSRCSRSGRLLP